MTVKELIARLKEVPEDMEVHIVDPKDTTGATAWDIEGVEFYVMSDEDVQLVMGERL